MSGPLIAIAAAGTAYSIYNGERAASEQKKAQAEARANAKKQADAADQAFNAANKKSPDAGAMLAGNQQAGNMGGGGATLLTGPQGVDPSALNLGKNTLLGA